ncbi:MAG: aspartate aminotransferase family protein [Thermoguttaceae bacterium]|nr:aspartate aminotransferase family protein [Thermoguttaceae bacterium]MBQ2683459.1 aspartate aminotransferase family protein [Thermoguttaceae bacterium]MBQ6620770.1 aspartate aminotransferase family protein [Thermoguttaceae bacterium]
MENYAVASSEEIISLFDQYVIPNYTRYPVALVRGEGPFVWDAEGRRYLDFFPGWGCNMFGHCPKPVVDAVREQVGRLIHIPNTWYTEEQGTWAKLLSERSFGGQAFFCNSGTEANEAAIKLVRLHYSSREKKRYKIITFLGAFHGRTMGSISATGQPKYHHGLEPLLPGFTYVPHGDLEAVENAIDDETAAIMIEPIQGEGGVRIPSREFLQGLRDLCDRNGLLLVFDEVQTGCGRTGEWFAYQYFGVEPDIMTLAKTICSGVAAGAMLARKEIAPSLRPGMHAATFGGNPLAAAAGIATIRMVESERLLDKAKAMGARFEGRLTEMAKTLDIIQDVRVAGAMIGVQLRVPGAFMVENCMKRGLLINCTQGNVIRLLPAVTTPLELVDEALDIIEEELRKA